MENLLRYLFGLVGGALAYLSPIHSLLWMVFAFVAVDFVTGVWASKKRALKRGEKWVFSSRRMRSTVYKLTFYIVGIIGAWLMQTLVFDFIQMRLERFFAGFILAVEFFSFLENASDISDHPVFRWLKKFTEKSLKDKTGLDVGDGKEGRNG
ncbi:MAG: phage holin family protein [Alistipes sp.]|jgi:hypothetical protein|nr:phage holin family protein [Alistipes sp.]